LNESLRRIAGAAYVVAAVFVVVFALDVGASSSLHFDPRNDQWRYLFAGYLTNYFIQPLFGLLIATVAATLRDERLMLRLLSWLSIAVTAVLVLMMVTLALDIVQLRSQVRDEDVSAFLAGGLKTEIKLAIYAVGLVFVGIAGLRAAKVMRAEEARVPLVR